LPLKKFSVESAYVQHRMPNRWNVGGLSDARSKSHPSTLTVSTKVLPSRKLNESIGKWKLGVFRLVQIPTQHRLVLERRGSAHLTVEKARHIEVCPIEVSMQHRRSLVWWVGLRSAANNPRFISRSAVPR